MDDRDSVGSTKAMLVFSSSNLRTFSSICTTIWSNTTFFAVCQADVSKKWSYQKTKETKKQKEKIRENKRKERKKEEKKRKK